LAMILLLEAIAMLMCEPSKANDLRKIFLTITA
jgi:hypothetical protein